MFRATVDKDALQEWDAEFVETFSAINTELDVQDVTPVVPIKIVASTSWYARYADDGDQSPTLIAGARTSTCRIYSQSRARTLVSGSGIAEAQTADWKAATESTSWLACPRSDVADAAV